MWYNISWNGGGRFCSSRPKWYSFTVDKWHCDALGFYTVCCECHLKSVNSREKSKQTQYNLRKTSWHLQTFIYGSEMLFSYEICLYWNGSFFQVRIYWGNSTVSFIHKNHGKKTRKRCGTWRIQFNAQIYYVDASVKEI